MADNRAAEKVVRERERLKQKIEAMQQGAEDGLKALWRDIQRKARLQRELTDAMEGGGRGNYQEWKNRFDGRHEEVGSEFTGFSEDRPWERE